MRWFVLNGHCLCSGHKQKDCRSNLTCSTCGSGMHHALLCRNNSKSDKSEQNKPKQKPKDAKTSAFNTETTEAEDSTAVDSNADTTEVEQETTNHCLSVYSLSEV